MGWVTGVITRQAQARTRHRYDFRVSLDSDGSTRSVKLPLDLYSADRDAEVGSWALLSRREDYIEAAMTMTRARKSSRRRILTKRKERKVGLVVTPSRKTRMGGGAAAVVLNLKRTRTARRAEGVGGVVVRGDMWMENLGSASVACACKTSREIGSGELALLLSRCQTWSPGLPMTQRSLNLGARHKKDVFKKMGVFCIFGRKYKKDAFKKGWLINSEK